MMIGSNAAKDAFLQRIGKTDVDVQSHQGDAEKNVVTGEQLHSLEMLLKSVAFRKGMQHGCSAAVQRNPSITEIQVSLQWKHIF
mmetsp:Transcript_9182/g.55749  ORF Transcript_9182/g.55749 Transcript_9182/m.55749 type:complete len:84 (+) Transcript_9182:1630-1881(+)